MPNQINNTNLNLAAIAILAIVMMMQFTDQLFKVFAAIARAIAPQ